MKIKLFVTKTKVRPNDGGVFLITDDGKYLVTSYVEVDGVVGHYYKNKRLKKNWKSENMKFVIDSIYNHLKTLLS